MLNSRLSGYLPEVLHSIKIVSDIMRVETDELDRIAAAVRDGLDSTFVRSATLQNGGIERWEQVFGIVPNACDTEGHRRRRLMLKVTDIYPYTVRSLEDAFSVVYGDDNDGARAVAVSADGFDNLGGFSSNVQILISARVYSESEREVICRYVRARIPANMLFDVSIAHNTHGDLQKYTHGFLRDFRHSDIVTANNLG